MNTSDDFDLRRALRALKQDRAPVNDLWPAIEARIGGLAVHPPGRIGRRQDKRFARWAAALAAGVVLVVGLIVAPDMNRSQDDATGSGLMADHDLKADAAQTLVEAYANVLAAERDRGAQWASQLTVPGGADRMAAALELDASLTELAAALRIEPQSQLLRRLMHQTLQQRAALTLDALDA